MNNTEIIILSLSISFCVTQIWQPIKRKPFNCMMCLTGWCAFFISEIVYGHYSIIYFSTFEIITISSCFFCVGCFIGAIVDAAMNKYL